jgi:hypothetical protein
VILLGMTVFFIALSVKKYKIRLEWKTEKRK